MKIKDTYYQRFRTVYIVELEGSDEARTDEELIVVCSARGTGVYPGGVVVRGRDGRAVVHVWKD